VNLAGWQDRGGVLATAGGLVFHGSVTGKLDIFDADTGTLLKSIDTGSSMLAAPMTYKVKGVQYVAIQTGWGGGGWGFVPPYAAAYKYSNANRILVFKLDGGPVPLPQALPPLEVAPPPPPQLPGVTPAMIAHGQALYFDNCTICHANQPRSLSPDLRRLAPEKHAVFDQILLEGLFVPNGMPRWGDLLTKQDADSIHAWLIDEQVKLRKRELELKRRGLPLDSRSLTIISNF
jgi:quinohemoprotein ethanol dehydrogenase